MTEATEKDLLLRIAQELTDIRKLVTKAVNALHEAETEVPEKIRRFTMFSRDMHDSYNQYEEKGLTVPDWIRQEVERCDDRLRQLLKEQHSDGNTFERVRREMAKDTENRYDHTRLLGGTHETRIRKI